MAQTLGAPELLRHSTVGDVVHIRGLPGLVEFLQSMALLPYYEQVSRWSEQQGACEVSELVENADELAKALRLPAEKREELKRAGVLASRINARYSRVKSKLCKAVSTPVTRKEAEGARESERTARLGVALIHAAWADPMERTETDLWDDREAKAHALAMQDRLLSYSEPEVEQRSQGYDAPLYRVDWQLLRQRNPTQAEVEVKDRAIKAARDQVLADWGPEKSSSEPRHMAFEAMREQFLEQYAGNLHAELGRGYKLTPAEVAPAVKDRKRFCAV